MITINNITKKYGENIILDNMSYEFKSTGITCILGPSGCGKTTLLNLLAGFDTDYSGDISVLKKNITKLDANSLCQYRKNNVGYIFQNYNLLMGYTVLESILLASELNHNTEQENIKKSIELVTKLGIKSKLYEKVENLSGGQKQRVAIARALINDPKIILADEPTGALDRSTSSEIMGIIEEISKDRLIVLITHDKKICDYATEVISIVNSKISVITTEVTDSKIINYEDNTPSSGRIQIFKRAIKNFRIHFIRYILVSIAIAIGIAFCIVSLSSRNAVDLSIEEFKEKNTAFNNGYIKSNGDSDMFDLLTTNPDIENIYQQYILKDISITYGDELVEFQEKYPTSKATANMSYGVMPRKSKNEISMSPSLAKKLSADISSLIGKSIKLHYKDEIINLTISGIFDYDFDDFFISSDSENRLYSYESETSSYSISYDVKDFNDIVSVSLWLKSNDIDAKTAVKQVQALNKTFYSLNRLFIILSGFVLVIGLFISIVLLVKLTNTRFREVGLLSALGYSQKNISGIIRFETILLSVTATAFSTIMLLLSSNVYNFVLNKAIVISVTQLIISALITFTVILTVSSIISQKLVKMEPADALKR